MQALLLVARLSLLIAVLASVVWPLPSPQGGPASGQSTQASTSAAVPTSLVANGLASVESEGSSEDVDFDAAQCYPLWDGFNYTLINMQTNESFASCVGCVGGIAEAVVQRQLSSNASAQFTIVRNGNYLRLMSSDGGYLGISQAYPAGNEGGHYAQITNVPTTDGQVDWEVNWHANGDTCYISLKNIKDYLFLSVCPRSFCPSVPNAPKSMVLDQPLAALSTILSPLTMFQYQLAGTPPIPWPISTSTSSSTSMSMFSSTSMSTSSSTFTSTQSVVSPIAED